MTPALSIRDLTVEFGAVRALNRVSLDFESGARIGLVGPNGAGKTTLLNAVAGFTVPVAGQILMGGKEIRGYKTRSLVRQGIVRGFQKVRLLERETVETNVLLGRERFARFAVLEQLAGSPRARRLEASNRSVAESVMAMLGLSDVRAMQVAGLAFGKRRLVEVARVLAAEPQVMLLDEPMAGLDARSRLELGDLLVRTQESLKTTMIVVEHDTEIVRRVCTQLAVLDAGIVIAEGAPDDVFASARVRQAYFGRRHA